MRLFTGKIALIAKEIARVLVTEGDIVTDSADEVEMDIQAVLKEYQRTERDLVERTKDLLEQKKLTHTQFGKVKKQLAEQRQFGMGDDSLDYITDQIIGAFMHSAHVDEVFAEDHDLRRKMRPILKKHMSVDEEVDREVRDKIKNLEEGTRTWEVEYQKVMVQIKRRRGLD